MGGGLSKDNTQECQGGSTLHGSSVDKAGTSARGLGRGTRRRTRFAASCPRILTLSRRERRGVDCRGGGGWGGRTLLAGEVGALQKWMSSLSSLNGCWYTYRDDGTESTRLIERNKSDHCFRLRSRRWGGGLTVAYWFTSKVAIGWPGVARSP